MEEALDPLSLAWAAGLFEGEGSVVAARRRDRHYARLIVNSTDLDVLERWQSIMGGKIYQRKPNPQALGKKIGYYVELGRQAESIPAIRALLPWLGKRRRSQAEAVLAKVESNAPTLYGTGWARRRALYGPNGRRDITPA